MDILWSELVWNADEHGQIVVEIGNYLSWNLNVADIDAKGNIIYHSQHRELTPKRNYMSIYRKTLMGKSCN